MIRMVELSESKNYKKHKYDKNFQKQIKVDVCIIINNIETYYSINDEIIYIDALNHKYYNKHIEQYETLSKQSLIELMDYLGWENWNMSIMEYGVEKGIMRIKHINKKTPNKLNKLRTLNISGELNDMIGGIIDNNPHKILVKQED